MTEQFLCPYNVMGPCTYCTDGLATPRGDLALACKCRAWHTPHGYCIRIGQEMNR